MTQEDLFSAPTSEKDNLIQQANIAYDQGEPLLEDNEFDLLADTGINVDTRNFRSKVPHPFPMGSLNKIKTAEDFAKWLGSAKSFGKSPKIDGASYRLKYVEGILQQVVSRGDGSVGNDCTANAINCNIAKTLKQKVTLEIRCEAVIEKIHAAKFGNKLRQSVAGMLGAKDPRPELALVNFIAIDVVTGSPLSIQEKRSLLESLLEPEMIVDFSLAMEGSISKNEFCDASSAFDILEGIYDGWKETLPYKIDGMVIDKFDDINAPQPVETELLPKEKAALKFSTEEAESCIVDIEWALGQHGKLTPVLQIVPVELDGSTVSRVSASNYSLLKSAGLGIGASVAVIKSGEIIPKIQKVLSESRVGLELPPCPSCGVQSVLNETSVDAVCRNEECEGSELVKLQKTVALFDIDFISGNTIEALYRAGYNSLEAIFSLSEEDIAGLPGFGEKSAKYLVQSLKSVELTEAKVIKSVFMKGIGERKALPLLKHYGGLKALCTEVIVDGMADIEGFGEVQTALINENAGKIMNQYWRFQELGIKILPHVVADTSGGVVCCTGTCSLYGRKELKEVLEERGYSMVSSVTKETTLLLCDDPNGKSSKLQKARKQGTAIQSYDDFFARENGGKS